MFLSVIVYWRLLAGPTGTPASTFESTSAGAALPAESVTKYAPRPCVPAARILRPGSRSSCHTDTFGMPTPRTPQWTPPSWVTNAPTWVPAYNVFGYDGSSTREFRGTSGRLPVMFFHDLPPSVVANA